MAKAKRASTRPSDSQEGGGQFGFPPGSVVTIEEGAWVEAEEAGEKFIGKGGPDDPVLKLVGAIKGIDEPRTVYLRAGKRARGLYPSKDGQFLDIEEGSTATALTEGCNADIFLKSISDKKQHGKMAVPESLHDDGINAVLEGLQFVAGSVIPKREGLENRPTLVAEEVLKLPKAAKGGGGRAARDEDEEEETPRPRRRGKAKDEDEEEEEEEPAERPRRGKGKGKSDEDDAEKKAEETITEILESPKYAKGLPVEKAWSVVYNKVRDEENKKEIMALVEDDDWLTGDRPWKVKGKGEDAVLLPVS